MVHNSEGEHELKIVGSTKRPTGTKTSIAMLPGVMILHRLLKNLRYWANSRRGTVGGIKRVEMEVPEAVAYTESIFRKIDGLVDSTDGWEGKRVLEVGPGDSLGTGLWCLGAGAKSYMAVDRFAVALNSGFEKSVFGEILSRMPIEHRARCGTAAEALEVLKQGQDRFCYRNDLPIERAPDVLGEDRFDVIFSNAVLEHVGDLEGTLSAMWDLLAPDGIMFHDVDLRSHQTYENDPLHFLEYPKGLWKWMSSHNGEPNRVRMPKYLKLIEDLGFEKIEKGVTQIFEPGLVSARRDSLAAEFCDLSSEELSPAVFWFACRKSGLRSNSPS